MPVTNLIYRLNQLVILTAPYRIFPAGTLLKLGGKYWSKVILRPDLLNARKIIAFHTPQGGDAYIGIDAMSDPQFWKGVKVEIPFRKANSAELVWYESEKREFAVNILEKSSEIAEFYRKYPLTPKEAFPTSKSSDLVVLDPKPISL